MQRLDRCTEDLYIGPNRECVELAYSPDNDIAKACLSVAKLNECLMEWCMGCNSNLFAKVPLLQWEARYTVPIMCCCSDVCANCHDLCCCRQSWGM